MFETISLWQANCGFWYTVPFKRKLSLRFGGGIIGLCLPTREAVGWVTRFGKCLRKLNRIKFKLKQRFSSLEGESSGLLEVHLKK